MKYFIVSLCLFSVACGNKIPDRIDVVNSGTATVEFTASLRIIDQLTTLCTMQLAPIAYPTVADRSKATADCVFQHLSTIGGQTSALTDFVLTYCNEEANLAGMTEQQRASIAATCTALGG